MKKIKANCNLDGPYIFYGSHGRKHNVEGISHMFSRALNEIGTRNFRFHDLRHTLTSYLIMAGVDIMTVKELLGHKTLQKTLRDSHLLLNFKKSAVEMLRFEPDIFWTPKQQNEIFINNLHTINSREGTVCLDIQNGLE